MRKNQVWKSNVDTVEWFKAAGIRAIKTAAQTAVPLIPVAAMVTQVDWKTVLGCSATSAIISLLTSVLGIPEVEAKEEEEE